MQNSSESILQSGAEPEMSYSWGHELCDLTKNENSETKQYKIIRKCYNSLSNHFNLQSNFIFAQKHNDYKNNAMTMMTLDQLITDHMKNQLCSCCFSLLIKRLLLIMYFANLKHRCYVVNELELYSNPRGGNFPTGPILAPRVPLIGFLNFFNISSLGKKLSSRGLIIREIWERA